MQPFAYGEEMRVWHVGKPHLAFEQRTWSIDAAGVPGRLLQGESGYLRCGEDGSLEMVVAMAPGHVDAPSAAGMGAVKRTFGSRANCCATTSRWLRWTSR